MTSYTRKFLIIALCLLGYFASSYGQGFLYIDSPDFVVDDTLFVGGNLFIDENGNIDNRKYIYLDSSLSNNSSAPLFEPSSYGKIDNTSGNFKLNRTYIGDIFFIGDSTKSIANTTKIIFSNINNKIDTLELQDNVNVLGNISNKEGFFNLNGNVAYLYFISEKGDPRYTGTISKEYDTCKVIDSYINSNDFQQYGYIEALKNLATPGGDKPKTNANKFESIGISFDKDFGVTKIRRYHYSDSTVSDGSIRKVFHLDFAKDAKNASANMRLTYVDSTDLLPGMDTSKLWLWSIDSVYTQYPHLDSSYSGIYFASASGKRFSQQDSILGNARVLPGSKYTLAHINCDSTPNIDISDTDTINACVNDNIRLSPFNDSTDFRDYFYRWHAPDSLNPKSGDYSVSQLSFKVVEEMADSIFSISLDVRDFRGCESTDSVVIVVREATDPIVLTLDENLDTIASQVCVGQPFFLHDKLNPSDIDSNYTWMFPNDTLLHQPKQIKCQLNTPGNKIMIKVRYKNKYGCIGKLDHSIQVQPLPTLDIEISDPICQGSITTIINNSSIPPKNPEASIYSYNWHFLNIDSVYTNGAIITSSGNNYFKTTYVIDTIQNPDLDYHFTDTGHVDLVLTSVSEAQCSSTDTFQLYVSPSVKSHFDTSSANNVCANSEALFWPGDSCSRGNGISYEWNLFDKRQVVESDTASFIYTAAKTYPITLVVKSEDGCADTSTKNIVIHKDAVAEFAVDNHCFDTNSTTRIKNYSKDASSFHWDYGNGISDTIGGITYQAPGLYPITLSANNQHNCIDSVTHVLEVYPLPSIAFTSDTGSCINAQNTLFQNKSSGADSLLWNFGNGFSSTEEHPNALYQEAGLYYVTLEGISAQGCKNSFTDTIRINRISDAQFDAELASVCQGSESQFIAGNLESNLNRISWNFGNGHRHTALKSEPDINYTYPTSGTYTATMITYTDVGCSDTAIGVIDIAEYPQVEITSEGQNCANSEIVFTLNENASNSVIDTYSWNFGDYDNPKSNFSQAASPSHFYSTSKDYEVSILVTSNKGCRAADTIILPVKALPKIAFGDTASTCASSLNLIAGTSEYNYLWSNGSTDTSINVTTNNVYSVSATNPNTGCTSWKQTEVALSASVRIGLPEYKEVCDNAFLEAYNPGSRFKWSTGDTTGSISANQSGTYWVKVTDLSGCTGTDSVELTVNQSPELNLNPQYTLCNGTTLSLMPGNINGTYTWNTGASTQSIDVSKSGHYWVSVSDVNSCSSTAHTDVIFHANPIVFLGEDKAVCEDKLSTISARNPGSSYLWSTGDTTQTITPTASGNYTVEVTNAKNCSAFDSVYIQVNPLPIINLGTDLSLCRNEALTLDAGNEGAAVYLWSNSRYTQQIDVTEPSTYWVRVTDNNGCSALSESVEVSYRELPYAPFELDNDVACNYLLLDAKNPLSTYQWFDGFKGSSYKATNSGIYWVDITNSLGCSIRDSLDLTINPMAIVNLEDNVSICDNGAGFIDAGFYGDDYRYEWSTGSTEQFIRVTAKGKYAVDVIHKDGCVGTDSTIVELRSSPVIDLGSEIMLCKNSGLTLDAGTPGSTYFWGNTSGLNHANQTLELADTGKHWVYVMAPNGCSNADTVEVMQTSMSIEPLFMCASNIRVGDTVRFVDLSIPTPTEYYWNFGDNINSTEKEPTHLYYNQRDYKVKMVAYNEVCSASITKNIKVEGYNPYYLIKMAEENSQPNLNFISIDHVKIYPNPTRNYVTLEMEISEMANVGMYLFNINGQLLRKEKFNSIERFEYQIDLTDLSEGLYFIRLVTVNEAKIFKVLKVR